jgi:hypothetical protein
MAAAGKWLKMERRPRGNRSRAHLVLGWSEEAAPREGGDLAAVLRGGGAKGRRRCGALGKACERSVVRCGAARRPGAYL